MKWYFKAPNPDEYQLITTLTQLEELTAKIKVSDGIAIDTETDGLHTDCKLVGVAVAGRNFSPAYIPVGHTGGTQLPVNRVKLAVHDWLTTPWYGHNFKFDYVTMIRNGWPSKTPDEDTILMWHLLDPDHKPRSMDHIAEFELGLPTVKFRDVVSRRLKRKTFADVPLHEATRYAAEDADITLRIYHSLKQRMDKELRSVYETLCKPLQAAVAGLEVTGMPVSVQALKTQHRELQSLSDAHLDRLTNYLGDININSSKQLAEVLYEEKQLPLLKVTAKGAPATDKATLENLSTMAPDLAPILDYKKIRKLMTTYTSKLQQWAVSKGDHHRIYASFNPTGTATGRLSSSRPNLQQIPSHGELGSRVREAFHARPGYKLVAADYSQMELRILGHYSGDPTFRDIFAQDGDLHAETARRVFTDGAEPSKEDRFKAKAINFGLMYGLTPHGLSKRLEIPVEQAEEYILAYFLRFPGVKEYLDNVVAFAHKHGYVETLAGRRRLLPDIYSNNKYEVWRAERQAQNAPIQGSAADITNMALIKLHKLFSSGELEGHIVCQVHDELLFEIPVEKLHQTDIIKNVMENIYKLKVDMRVDVGVGDNWAEAH